MPPRTYLGSSGAPFALVPSSVRLWNIPSLPVSSTSSVAGVRMGLPGGKSAARAPS